MDKFWDRKSFEVRGHWPLWQVWKNKWPRRIDKSKTLKNKQKKQNKNYSIILFLGMKLCGCLQRDIFEYIKMCGFINVILFFLVLRLLYSQLTYTCSNWNVCTLTFKFVTPYLNWLPYPQLMKLHTLDSADSQPVDHLVGQLVKCCVTYSYHSFQVIWMKPATHGLYGM
mgnify:CR=1 FL=1